MAFESFLLKVFLLLSTLVALASMMGSPPPRCYERRPSSDPECGRDRTYYYFNPRKGRCTSFLFNGCGNSRNAFRKRSECQLVCACNLDLNEGYHCGKPYAIRYYWDYESRLCRKFWYSGCGGNHNRFQSKKRCKKVCRGY